VKNRIILIVVVAILSIGGDQAAKWWARDNLKDAPMIKIVDGYLDLTYHENKGSAFGLLRNVPGARYILIGVGVFALIFVGAMVRKVERFHTAADLGFGFVIGGAVGNLLDRIYNGRVVDFVLMHWKDKVAWPVYNVADAELVAGVALLILVLGRKPETAQPKKKRSR
jgi:signal peptidase II